MDLLQNRSENIMEEHMKDKYAEKQEKRKWIVWKENVRTFWGMME